MKNDSLFKDKELGRLSSFAFDKRVVDVFDDMINRSVPGYSTIQLLVSDLALAYSNEGWIYDLGCSTGNTMLALSKRTQRPLKIIGIDQSKEMILQAKDRLAKLNKKHQIKIKHADILDEISVGDRRPSVAILNLVLQFVRPMERPKILSKIHQSLLPGGCLILVEKTIETDPEFNRFYVDYYHKYKKEMGYSEMEISRKREALENCLIPFTKDENLALLRESGFEKVSTFFQWMNFCGFIGLKQEK